MARKIVAYHPDLQRESRNKAARRLGICKLTVDRLIDRGELAVVASIPGIPCQLLSSSVNALVEKMNATATCDVA